MTRIVFACVASLAVVSTASAQPKEKSAVGTTKIAVVNVGFVFTNYSKANVTKAELDGKVAPFKARASVLMDEIMGWDVIVKLPDVDPTRKEKLERAIRKNKRELEELQLRLQMLIGERQEDKLMELWKDIQGGIKICAREQGIKLVFAYGDPRIKDLDLFPNVQRKLQALDAGSVVPLFVEPEADLSQIVVEYLNKQHREKNLKR